jgi:hypothetical protein
MHHGPLLGVCIFVVLGRAGGTCASKLRYPERGIATIVCTAKGCLVSYRGKLHHRPSVIRGDYAARQEAGLCNT